MSYTRPHSCPPWPCSHHTRLLLQTLRLTQPTELPFPSARHPRAQALSQPPGLLRALPVHHLTSHPPLRAPWLQARSDNCVSPISCPLLWSTCSSGLPSPLGCPPHLPASSTCPPLTSLYIQFFLPKFSSSKPERIFYLYEFPLFIISTYFGAFYFVLSIINILWGYLSEITHFLVVELVTNLCVSMILWYLN